MIAYTQQIAIQNAELGVRANVILPGLMETPMAVENRVKAWGKTRDQVVAERNAQVPLRHQMGTAWDVANAGTVPRLGRGELRHRRGAAGGRWRDGAHRLSNSAPVGHPAPIASRPAAEAATVRSLGVTSRSVPGISLTHAL
jgi:hypothetical protein